jgi:hypothetical protein
MEAAIINSGGKSMVTVQKPDRFKFDVAIKAWKLFISMEIDLRLVLLAVLIVSAISLGYIYGG